MNGSTAGASTPPFHQLQSVPWKQVFENVGCLITNHPTKWTLSEPRHNGDSDGWCIPQSPISSAALGVVCLLQPAPRELGVPFSCLVSALSLVAEWSAQSYRHSPCRRPPARGGLAVHPYPFYRDLDGSQKISLFLFYPIWIEASYFALDPWQVVDADVRSVLSERADMFPPFAQSQRSYSTSSPS